MRTAIFCGAMILSSCAQAAERPAGKANVPIARSGKVIATKFLIRPNTHVCVSARISDDMPGLRPVPETVHNISSWLTGEIFQIVQRRKSQDLYYRFLTHRSPQCASNPDNINVYVNYYLNSNRKPFAVRWTIYQGDQIAKFQIERDISREEAEGRRFGSSISNTVQVAIADDARTRAIHIASQIR